MIPITYTISDKLKENLSTFDALHQEIRSTPLDIATYLRLSFETLTSKIYYALLLSSYDVERDDIAKIVTHQIKNKKEKSHKRIEKYAAALKGAEKEWTLNRSGITAASMIALHNLAAEGDIKIDNENELKHILNYVQVSREHPLIQAALVSLLIVKTELFTEGNRLFSSLLFDLFLVKEGYTENFFCIDHYFADHRKEFRKKEEELLDNDNVSELLTFVVESAVAQLRFILDVTHNKGTLFRSGLPKSFFKLTPRQKNIAALSDIPKAQLTNKKVQILFGVSQITASRDLAKLSIKGLVTPNGRGRSIYYTRF